MLGVNQSLSIILTYGEFRGDSQFHAQQLHALDDHLRYRIRNGERVRWSSELSGVLLLHVHAIRGVNDCQRSR